MSNNLVEDRVITNVFHDDEYVYSEELVQPHLLKHLLQQIMISRADDEDENSQPDILARNNNCEEIHEISEINEPIQRDIAYMNICIIMSNNVNELKQCTRCHSTI